MDQYFASRVDAMDKDANVVVIFGGTNDYGHGDAAKGRMTDRTPDTFYGALHDLYQKFQKTFPEAEIIVMTPGIITRSGFAIGERLAITLR